LVVSLLLPECSHEQFVAPSFIRGEKPIGVSPGAIRPIEYSSIPYIQWNPSYWRDIVCQQIGVPDLLWIWGQLENLKKGSVRAA
jgi:hypothetical protein